MGRGGRLVAAFRLLSDDAIHQIHEATLDLLAEVGVRVGESRLRQLMLQHGCRPLQGDLVGIPRELVAETMMQPQAPLVLNGIDEKRSLVLDGSACYLQNFGSASVVHDPESGELRDACAKDAVDIARLLDALPHCHHAGPVVIPEEMHPLRARLMAAAATLKYTGKPLSLGAVSDAHEAALCVEMSRVASPPGRPVGRISISPVSPLTFPTDICEAILVAAPSGLPLLGLPCPMRAVSAPLYLAGTMTAQNAENLAFGVMARLVNRDVRLMHASRIFTPSMRTGAKTGSDPDIGIAGAGMVQLAKFYGLPSNVYGMETGAVVPDAQAGFEKTANTLRPMLAGADQISGLGQLGGGMVASVVQAVIDDEIFSFLSHHVRGLVVEPGTIDLEGFGRVMRAGEDFLIQESTMRAMSAGEAWEPRIGNADSWNEWLTKGRQTALDRAKQFARDCLDAEPVRYLSEQQERALDAIVDAAIAEGA